MQGIDIRVESMRLWQKLGARNSFDLPQNCRIAESSILGKIKKSRVSATLHIELNDTK